MRVVLIASAALALAGCGGGRSDATPDAGRIPLELTVSLYPGDSHIVVGTNQPDPRRSCSSSSPSTTHPECTNFGDVISCREGTPLPADTCFVRASLLAGGLVTGVTVVPLVGSFEMSLAQGADTLVLSGCGKEARIPLPAPLTAGPQIVGLGVSSDALVIDWVSDEPPSAVSASLSGGFGGTSCQVPTSSPAHLPASAGGLRGSRADLGARISRGELATQFGPVRLGISTWHGSAQLNEAYRNQDHWTILPIAGVEVRIGGVPRMVRAAQLDFDIEADGTRIVGWNAELPMDRPPPPIGGVRYLVTPTGASLEVDLETGIYRATLAPVVPSDPLVLGRPVNETFAMTIGPIEVVNDSGARMQVEVVFSAGFGAVVRPL